MLADGRPCGPFYTTESLPPLIPPGDAGIKLFPFLDDATFHAQTKATSEGSPMSFEEACVVIEEQNAQILSLNRLIEELRAEKASLEEQLADYQGPRTPRRGTTPFNPITPVSSNRTISQTPRSGTLQRHHGAPGITISSPSHSVATLRKRSPVSPAPTRHSVSTQPSPSTPVQPTHYQVVTPLRSIGPETEFIFDSLQIPDRFHRNVCEIVEQVLPIKWRASLLELGFIDASNVQCLVEAIETDVSPASSR